MECQNPFPRPNMTPRSCVNGPAMIPWFRTLLLILGWSLALAAGFWKYHTLPGVVAIALAGGLAVMGAAAMDAGLPRFHELTPRQARLRRFGMMAMVPLIALLGCGIARWWLDGHATFSIPSQLLARVIFVSAPLVFASLFLIRRLVQAFPPLGILELMLATGWAVQLVSGHRMALGSPAWLMDACIRNGHDPLEVIRILGVGACLLGLVFLLGQATDKAGQAPITIGKVISGVLLMLILTGGVYLYAPRKEAPLVAVLPPPLVPGSPQEPPPPPPPQPRIVAWVEFLDGCLATPRLGGHYFREAFIDDADKLWNFVENGPDAAASFRHELPGEGQTPTGPEERMEGKVTTRIHLLAGSPAPPTPPVLVTGNGFLKRIPVRDTRFAASWEVSSTVPGKDSIEDLRIESPRMKLLDPAWIPEELDRLKALPPQAEPILTAKASILSEVPRYRAGFDNARLQAVISLTKKAFQGKESEWSFPETSPEPSKSPNPSELSRRCVILLRAVGIPSRLATGYKYPMVEGEEKSGLALTNEHKTWWPEVYLKDTGWLPVVLPVEGKGGREPSNLTSVEEMLAASLDTEVVPPPGAAPEAEAGGDYRRWGLLTLACGLTLPAMWILLLAPVISSRENRPRATLRAAAGLLALDGHRRQFGETRRDFAGRLPPPLSDPMRQLADTFTAVKYDTARPSRATTLRPLRRLLTWFLTGGCCRIFTGVANRDGKSLGKGLLWYFCALNPFFLRNADKPAPDSSLSTHASTS